MAVLAVVRSLFRVSADVVIRGRRSSHYLVAQLALITIRHFVCELRDLALLGSLLYLQ